MRNLMQEKFQTTLPEPPAGSNEWVPDSSARKAKAAPADLNQLPPGSDIERQDFADATRAPRTMSGETDVSKDWNREAVQKGYKRLGMKPTDDAYTDEHVAPFYSSRIVDGDEGFVENNNVLDRQ
jgi:hypothetical protein